MDEDVCTLVGDDLEAWFDALERGDFARAWETQQQRIQKLLRDYAEGRETEYDASED